MNRTWTDVGACVYDPDDLDFRDEDGEKFTQERIVAAIDALDWQATPPGRVTVVAASPGLAIKVCIAELRIPKVSAFAISHELAPYGLYGIEGNYRNGRVRVYVLDAGAEIKPLASDHWPKETANA